MGATVTVDIQAKVTGYEDSLKQLRAAFAKIDPGSDIGKKLSKAFLDAESQVKSLGKNMFPKISNQNQLDAIVDKTNRAGDAIRHVIELMQQVGATDLNFGALGANITAFRDQIVTLETELNDKLSKSLQDAVNNSDSLKKLFSSLGTNISQADVNQLFTDLAKGSAAAVADLEEAEKKLTEIGLRVTKAQKTFSKVENSPLNSREGRNDLQNQIRSVQSEYDKVFTDLREHMQAGLTKLKIENQDQILDQFFNGLTPNNIKEKINELFQTLYNSDFYTGVGNQREQFYTDIFFGGKNIDSAIKNINLQGQLDPIKAKFLEIMSSIDKDLSIKESSKVLDLLDQGNLSAAADQALKVIDSAFARVAEAYRKGKEELDAVLDEQKKQAEQVSQAKDAVTSFTQGEQILNQEKEAALKKEQDLNDRLQDARTKAAQAIKDEVFNIRDTATKNSNTLPSFPIDEASQYAAQLDRIQQRTQMLGKVQGVVQRWFSIYAAVRMASKAIRSVMQTTKELDSTITEIAIVTKMNQSDLWGQMDNYTKLATKYAASISGVYKVSQLYYQQGLQTNEVMQLTEQTLKMARISGLDYSEATDYMTNAIRSFKMEMSDAQTVVDVYSAVAASSATSVTELATAMSKTASSAEAVGSSFENTTAMLAVMIEATRESPENIGSAMKSIISRYGELKEQKVGIDEEGEEYNLNKVDKALQTVGISLHDAKGEFRDFDDVIFELAQKWNTIDKNTQRYIATIMAGNRQQSRFLALVSSAERLKEESDKATNSEDASQLQFLKTLDSVEAKTQQLQTSLQSLYTDSGIQNLYKSMLDFGNNIITTFSSLDEVGNFPILAISKFATMFSTIAVLVTNVFNLVKNQYKIQETLIQNHINTRLNLERQLRDAQANGDTARITQLENALNKEDQLYQEHMNKRQRISLKTNQGKGLLASSVGMIGSIVAANMDEETQRVPKGLLTGASSILSGVGTFALMGGGWAGALMGLATALTGIIESIGILQETTEERVAKLKSTVEETNNEKLKSKDDLKTLTEYKNKYDTLYKSQHQSAEAKKEFIKLQNEIATNYPELISSMDAEGNYIVDMTSSYEQLAQAKANTYNENYMKNLSAELEALQDISYVLTEVYGVNLKGQHSIFEQLGFSGGENNLDRIYTQLASKNRNTSLFSEIFSVNPLEYGNDLDLFTKGIWGALKKANNSLSSLMTEDTIKAIFGEDAAKKHKRGLEYGLGGIVNRMASEDNLFGAVSGIVDRSFGITRGKFSNLIEEFYSAAEQGMTLSEAQKMISANSAFADYTEAINNFSATVYQNFTTEAAAIKFQQELIDKKISTALQEQVSTLSSISGLDVGNFQSKVIALRLKQDWEQYQKDVEAGQKKDANGNTIKKIGEKFTPEGKTEEKVKTLADLYQEFINQYDTAWYYQMEQNTHELQKSTIDSLYENKGQYSKQALQGLSAFQKLGDFKTEFLQVYDEDFKDTFELYDHFIKDNEEDFTIRDSNLLTTLSNFKNLVGPEFLQGIMDQYQTILDNESLTTEIKNNQLLGLTNILQSISNLQGQDQINALAEFQTADLTSLVGIYKFINKLKDLHIDSGVIDNLTNFSKDIVVNLNTELNTYLNDVANSMKDFESAVSSASKGMDFKTAVETAQKIGVNISDFQFRDGKYYTDNFDAIKEAYLGNQTDLQNALQESSLQMIETYRKTSNYTITNLSGGQVDWTKIRLGGYTVDNLKGILSENEKEFMERTGLDANSFIQMYQDFLDNLSSDSPITQFNDFVENNINSQTLSATEKGEQYAHTAIASAALAVDNLDEYFKNIFLANGNTTFKADELTKIAKDLLNGKDFESLLDFIPMAFREQLKNYIDDAKDDFYDFFTLSKHGQTIKSNEINSELLEQAAGAGLIKELGTVGKVTTYEMMKITQDSIDDYINFLESHPAEENKELLAEAYDWKSTNSQYNALKGVLVDSFDFATAQAFTESLGFTAEETMKVMKDYGFIYDAATNQFKQTEESLDKIADEVTKIKQKPPEDITQEDINTLEELAHTQEISSTVLKEAAIKDALDNYQTLSTEHIKNLANVLEMDYNDVLWYLTSDNLDGTRKLDLTKFHDLVQSGSLEISKTLQKNLADLIESTYTDTVSQMEGLFDSNLSGGKYSNVIGKAKKLLAQSKDSTIFLSDLVEYNDQLGGYILTSKAVELEFAQLREKEGKQLIDAQDRKINAVKALSKVSRQSIMSYDEDGMGTEEWIYKEINYEELRQAITESNLYETDEEREIAYNQLDALLEEYKTWSQLPEHLHSTFGEFLEVVVSAAKDNTQIVQDLVNQVAFSYISGQDYEAIASGQGAHLQQGLKSLLQQISPNMKDFDKKFSNVWADLLQGRFDSLNSWLSSENLPALSNTTIQKARQAYLQSFVDAGDELVKQKGEQVSLRAAEAMKAAGYGITSLGDGTGIITSVGNMVDAYINLYTSLQSNSDATTSNLNALYAKLLNAREQGDMDAINTMSDAMGMTYDALGEMLSKYNITLQSWLQDNTDVYTKIGGGKIRITDFETMAQRMGWKPGSEEYVSAFKSYNDSLIEMNRKTEKGIIEEIQGLSEAKGGDWLNLTELVNSYGEQYAKNLQKQKVKDLQKAGASTSEFSTIFSNAFYNDAYNQGVSSLAGQLAQYGGYLEKGILKLAEDANLYEIAQIIQAAGEEAGAQLSEELAAIAEAVKAVLRSYVEAINDGIDGTLDTIGKNDLTNKAKSLGIDNVFFEETAEGFKLADVSAMKLYQSIKQIDAIQGQIVFDKLAESLEETNENFESTTKILSRIHEIQKAMSDTTKELTAAQRDAFEEELKFAKEMAFLRTGKEDESLNFMSGDIPGGQKNVLNYAKNWTQALHAIRDAYEVEKNGQTGFMEYTDFYNIVNELNNLAGITGQSVTIGKDINGDAIQLDGSLESASKAIQAGIDTLTAVDTGDLMINLGGLGMSLAAGGASLEEGVTDGVHALAESEISAIDAMIAVLEIIVAMEAIGDVAGEDMNIDLGDIFSLSYDENGNIESVNGFSADYEKAQNKLKGILDSNEDLRNRFQHTKMSWNGNMITMEELVGGSFENLFPNINDLEPSQRNKLINTYQQTINGLYQAAISGKYDINDVATTLRQIMRENGLDLTDFVYEFTDENNNVTRIITFTGETLVDIDFQDADVQKAVDAYLGTDYAKNNDYKSVAKRVQEAIELYNNTTNNDIEIQDKINARILIGVASKEFTITESEGNGYEASYKGQHIYGSSQKDVYQKLGEAAFAIDKGYTFEVTGEGAACQVITKIKVGSRTYEVTYGEHGQEDTFTYKDKDGHNVKTGLTLSQLQAEVAKSGDTSWYTGQTGTILTDQEGHVVDIHVSDTLGITYVHYVKKDESGKDQDVYAVNGKEFTSIDEMVDYYKKVNKYVKSNNVDNTNDVQTITINEKTYIQIKRNTKTNELQYDYTIDGKDGYSPEAFAAYVGALDSLYTDISVPDSETKTFSYTIGAHNITLTIQRGVDVIPEYSTEIDGRMITSTTPEGIAQALQAFGESDFNTAETLTSFTVQMTTDVELHVEYNVVTGEPTFKANGETVTADQLISNWETYGFKDQQEAETFVNTKVTNKVTSMDVETEGVKADLDKTTFEASNPITVEAVASTVTVDASGAEIVVTGIDNVTLSSGSKGGATASDNPSEEKEEKVVEAIKEDSDISAEQQEETINAVEKQQKLEKVPTETFEEVATETIAAAATAATNAVTNGKAQPTGGSSVASVLSKEAELFEKEQKVMKALSEADLGINSRKNNKKDQKVYTLQENDDHEPIDGTVQRELVSLIQDYNAAGGTRYTLDGHDVIEHTDVDPIELPAEAVVEDVDSSQAPDTQVNAEAEVTTVNSEGVTADTEPLEEEINYTPNVEEPDTEPIDEDLNYTGKVVSTPTPPVLHGTIEYTGKIVDEGGEIASSATGNVALAQGTALAAGRKTLMGELGPELFVTNGGYYMAGADGPEMVNLPDDAIVFNHLQTRQLLKNGHTPQTGRAVKNEQAAVALASGRLGPAKSSAAAALAALKQIRGQWQALLGLTAQDLAGKGGGGGGGGGGGQKDIGPFVKELERWYNLLQEIARLEEEITYQEQLRAKIQSDLSRNGKAYYDSQKKSIMDLETEMQHHQTLAIQQENYFKKRQKEMNAASNPFSALYEIDDNGQLKYKEGALEKLSKLSGRDALTGKPNYDAKQQYEMLKSWGYEKYMKYDSSGNEIKLVNDEGEEQPEAYATAVQAFWDKIEADREEMQDLHDSIEEHRQAVLEAQEQQNELIREMQENQMELEENILDTIVDMRERAIEEMEEEKEAYEDSANKMIDGLTDALNKEKEMYERQEDQAETDRMRRRLAILLNSGGSSSEILDLQEQLRQRDKDAYFEASQQQIDAIKEASDVEIERLDAQIDLEKEILNYQKEHGLLWQQVYEVMNTKDPQGIAAFITENNSKYWEASPVKSASDLEGLLFSSEQWTAYRDDTEDKLAKIVNSILKNDGEKEWENLLSSLKDTYGVDFKDDEALKKIYLDKYLETSDPNESYKAVQAELTKRGTKTLSEQEEKKKKKNITRPTQTRGGGGGNYTGPKTNPNKDTKSTKIWTVYDDRGIETNYTFDADTKEEAEKLLKEKFGEGTYLHIGSETTEEDKDRKAAKRAEYEQIGTTKQNTKQIYKPSENAPDVTSNIDDHHTFGDTFYKGNQMYEVQRDGSWKAVKKQTENLVKQKASGGYVNHGLYELGELGTETVLTAEQTQVLRNNILSDRPNSLISLLKTYNSSYDTMIDDFWNKIKNTNENNTNGTVIIEHAEVNMNVEEIANDYDAQRAGQQALQEMLRIARKTSATSVRR